MNGFDFTRKSLRFPNLLRRAVHQLCGQDLRRRDGDAEPDDAERVAGLADEGVVVGRDIGEAEPEGRLEHFRRKRIEEQVQRRLAEPRKVEPVERNRLPGEEISRGVLVLVGGDIDFATDLDRLDLLLLLLLLFLLVLGLGPLIGPRCVGGVAFRVGATASSTAAGCGARLLPSPPSMANPTTARMTTASPPTTMATSFFDFFLPSPVAAAALLLLPLLALGVVLGNAAGRFLRLEPILALRALDLGADQVRIGDENLVLTTRARNFEAGHGASPRKVIPADVRATR